MIHAALVHGLLLGLLQAPAKGGEPSAAREFPELGLTVDLRGLAHLAPLENFGDMVAAWEGELEGSRVHVQIVARAHDGNVDEPQDVTDFLVPTTVDDLLRASASAGKKAKGATPASYLWPGAYGFVPYASIVTSRVEITAERTYDAHVLGGVLEGRYYAVQVECKPPLGDAANALVHDFLRSGIRYEGPLRDPEWTDEEVKARWEADTLPDMHAELEKPIRTKHFIVLGNSSGGALFGKKMEEFYDEIRKVYPFDEVPGRKLMPVFIFRTPDQYHDFLVNYVGMSRADAEQTAGIATGDLYTSVYEAPGDPVHLHEATHQIFRNRLRLGGGGSWFQEGVAEYMSTRSSERRAYAKSRAKDGDQVPFREFFTLTQLIKGGGQDEARGGAAQSNYLQAASIIEFVRESRRTKDRFQLFLHAVGSVPRGDVAAIEAALLKVFDLDIAGFEAEWVKYWK